MVVRRLPHSLLSINQPIIHLIIYPIPYRCALAMKGLSTIKSPGSRESAALLQNATRYLTDVVNTGTDDDGLRAAAAEALKQCEQTMMEQAQQQMP